MTTDVTLPLKHPTCTNVQLLRSLTQRPFSTTERLYGTHDLYSKFGTSIQDIWLLPSDGQRDDQKTRSNCTVN